jgi:hypothetical protein
MIFEEKGRRGMINMDILKGRVIILMGRTNGHKAKRANIQVPHTDD